ncbi:hypothetical protein [Methylobacterium sp. J-076]|uniref:hypothetical protein n=1 Tax=Methylobacterium sp. J-076 TaxID=2836655 RepID=UPI001FB890B0|nr:hypothetical protein [Methylobacterium sp. J-076]MCJ2011143.1 hypothetical protein [Methylobacterium sp. J-076]
MVILRATPGPSRAEPGPRERPARAAAGAILLALLALAPLPARAEVEPGDLTLTVTPELNGGAAPYAREMVLLRIHGVYRQPILLEEVVQPSLANFTWTQLGRDHWSKTHLPDGQSAIAFDRTVAIFPHHAGDFTLEPFTHRLTINDVGERKVVDVHSQPIPFTVAPWTAPTGGPDAKDPWWLPARDVGITDAWSRDPETVKVGETVRRTVTLEAQGVLAEGLPPRPVMRTRGIITFAGPVTRETVVTPAGPVARATYVWDVKPGVPEVIPLDAIAIPWFDTVSRTMREAEIPARQIGGGLPDRETDGGQGAASSAILAAAAGVLAFGLGLSLLGVRRDRTSLRLPAAVARDLRRAARSRDVPAFRAAVAEGERAVPGLARLWRDRPEIREGLAALDRAVYGPAGGGIPDLPALAQALIRHRGERPAAAAILKPLDGPA